MSRRHEAREWALQFLFQRDFNPQDELEMALADFWSGRKASAALRSFTDALIQGVEQNRADIDRFLQSYTENWDVRRMAAVDRNIMRLAVYEMLHCPDIPPVVSINEAVTLAKAFSSRESGRFVNGILDRIRRDLKRPAREPVPHPPDDEPGD